MKKKTAAKEYIVIGLGRFGSSVAKQLEANGCKVLAIDNNEKNVNMVADYVTLAMCADVTNEEALKELGMRNFDGAIVSMGHSLEAAVLAVIWAKEQGVSKIVAKAYDEMQGKILRKVGADDVIYPEREMGKQLANNLALKNVFDTIELSSDISIIDVPAKKHWIGKTLQELGLREKYQVNVIGIEKNGKLMITPSPTEPVEKEDIFLILGRNDSLDKL